jgi:FHS family glucose/mannose:H+ symporter-like MFS transporter
LQRPRHSDRSLESEPVLHAGDSVTIWALSPIFLYFVVAGVATVMLGPLLPGLIFGWNIEDAQAGTLFSASFAGQFLGAWFAARNLRVSVICGAALSAAGCIAMTWATFHAAHLAFFCVGLGLGAGLTAGNIIVGTARSSSRARLLLLLNVSWSIGAIACPLLVRACFSAGTGLFFLILAGGLTAAALLLLAAPRRVLDPERSVFACEQREFERLPLPVVPLVIFAGVLLLYVGVENALGGWLPSYAIRVHGSLQSSVVAFSFWIAELGGRLGGTVFLVRLRERSLYVLCLALLIAAGVVLVAGVGMSAGGILVVTALLGAAIGPVYPLIISFMLARTGQHPRVGALFASASLGGASLPWLTGVVSTHFQSLRAGLIVPVGGAVLMLLLSPVITKPSPKTEDEGGVLR